MKLPPGVVALDCASSRVASIARRYSLTTLPCLVRGGTVISGRALEAWFSSQRPAVVRFFSSAAPTTDDDDDDGEPVERRPSVAETAVEKGKRLAAERESQFGSPDV
jgi:hypothetical protein